MALLLLPGTGATRIPIYGMADFAGTGGHCPNHEGRSGTAAIAGHPIISSDECSNLGDESRLKCCPNAQASDHVVLIILNRSPRGTRFPTIATMSTGRAAGARAGDRRMPTRAGLLPLVPPPHARRLRPKRLWSGSRSKRKRPLIYSLKNCPAESAAHSASNRRRGTSK